MAAVDDDSKKMITLKSSDGEEFEVEEAVAMGWQIIRHMIEDDCADNRIPLPNVNSKILSKVIVYCSKHVQAVKPAGAAEGGAAATPAADGSSAAPAPTEDLKNCDAEFIKETMVSKEHAILLSVFLLFKFLSKGLIIPAFIACFIHGINSLVVMLPPIKRFLTKECNYKEAVSRTPLIHAVSVDFVNSRVLASIPGFFFSMWYAAKKYCLANNVLGISSCIQGIEISLGPLKTHTILSDGTNQLMGKVWDLNMYGAKLKKFDGWVLHTTNEDGERGEDGATALSADCGDGPEDGGSGPDDGGPGPEDGGPGPEDGGSGPGPEDGGCGSGPEDEDGSSGPDDSGMASKNSNDKYEPFVQRAVQLLAICANFPICQISGYDWQIGRCIYVKRRGEVQEEGMVDLVPTGPRRILMAYGYFSLNVYTDDESAPPIEEGWDVEADDEVEEYTRTICAGPGRKLEITYLVIPKAIEANVEVKLKLKDLGSRSCAVYGKIKASTMDYRNKSVHLFSCERGMSLSFPFGSTSILPLSPSVVAVPGRWQRELHIEVDLTVITCGGQGEQGKHFKFSLNFTREIMCQEREVDDDQLEVNIKWYPIGC